MNCNAISRYPLYIIFILTISNNINGQIEDKKGLTDKLEKLNFKAQIAFQFWSTYTIGQERYDESIGKYRLQANNWNNQLRRSRLGFSLKPYDFLTLKFTSSLDLVGGDINSATQGGKPNTTRQVQLWNMYMRFRPWINSDYLNITVGYQPPQVSRASIIAALRSSSFDKSWSQNYLRNHLVGAGNGRAMGMNIGGQQYMRQWITWSYDIGIYNTTNFVNESLNNQVTNKPLFTGRLSIHIGDPESEKYSTSHKVNYFGKRTGLSLGYSIAYQGKTQIFDENKVWSTDFLLNFKFLTIDGEYSLLKRNDYTSNTLKTSRATTSYVRLGYSISTHNGAYIEPVIMYTYFDGGISSNEIQDSQYLNTRSGTDVIYDFTINYHLSKNLKLSLSYINNYGTNNILHEDLAINNFYSDANGNTIKRGDLLAIAVTVNI